MSQTTTSKNSRSQQILGGTLLAIMSVCLTLFGLEILVRLLAPPYPPDTGHIYACHNSLGWMGKPDFDSVFEDSNFRQELNFNSLGMHDTEHALDKPLDTFRILFLGDSFVHAIQVGEAATAHQLLENNLNEVGPQRDTSFEVISSGVVNWGTNQELVYYREQGRRFQPDLVLLLFYIGNDFQDNLPGNVMTVQGINCYAPYFALCDGSLNPAPLTYAPGISSLENNCSPFRRGLINSMGTLYQRSRLYQQIEPLIVTHRPRQEFGRNYPLAFTALYLPTEAPELTQAYRRTQATTAQLRREVEADGAEFAVVLISPWPVLQLALLSPAEQEVFLKDNPLFAQAQADRPNQQMAQFLTNQNVPFIDLTTPMIEHLTHDGTPLYLLGEGHWTVAGNQVVADILAEWLTTTLQLEE